MFAEATTDSPARRFSMGIAVVLGVLVTALAARVCLQLGLGWKCPVMALIEVPCPSCGSTRAFAALANFDLLTALKFNPLIVLGILVLPGLNLFKKVPASLRQCGWWIFGAVVALNWLYLFLFLPR
jgi:hypothetical protein